MNAAIRTIGVARSERHAGRGAPADRRRRTRTGPLLLNMAPMIDMTFLLFSFVIVTSTFERPEGVLASRLPEEAGAPTAALPFSPIVIRLSRGGVDFAEFGLRIDRFENAPRDFTLLPDFLRQIQRQPGFDEQTPVVIVADEDVHWDHVVNCWNAAIRAGCQNIAFAEQ